MGRSLKSKVRVPSRQQRRRRLRVEALEERVVLSSVVPLAEFTYGLPEDVHHFMGDWDGDGLDTPGIYRDGLFHLRNSNTTGPGELIFAYGLPGDLPLVGDWDGDGLDTVGIVRDGQWHLRNTNTAGVADLIFAYGLPDDKAFVGDWNGDGTDTPGVVRGIQWHLRNSNDTGVAHTSVEFGMSTGAVGPIVVRVAGDVPLVGDWNGSGSDSEGFFFEDGSWVVSLGGAETRFTFGSLGDVPAVGDVTGDGQDQPGFVSGSVWTLGEGLSLGPFEVDSVASTAPLVSKPEINSDVGRNAGRRLINLYEEYREFVDSNPAPDDKFVTSEEILLVRDDGFVAVDVASDIPLDPPFEPGLHAREFEP